MLANTLLPPKSSLHFQSPQHPFRPYRSPLKPFIVVTSVKTTKSSATTLYQVLRIKVNASQTDIKAAYRNLAKLYHPDVTCSADSKGWDFIELHNAYSTLSDPVARAHYDMSIGATHQFRYSALIPGFRPTRRWETDQCW